MPGIYDHASDLTPAELGSILNDSFGAIQAAPLYKGIDPTKSPGVAPAGSMLTASPSMGTSLTSHPVTTYKVDASNWDNPTKPAATAISQPAQAVKYSLADLMGTSGGPGRLPANNVVDPPGVSLSYTPTPDKRLQTNGFGADGLSAIGAATGGFGAHSILGQIASAAAGKPMKPAANMAGAPKINTGDAWAGLRFGEPVVRRPGMVTGTPQGIMAPAVASQPASTLNVSNNINKFLGDQGVNTAGMTIGQQANAFSNSLDGSSRNADGSRGFM